MHIYHGEDQVKSRNIWLQKKAEAQSFGFQIVSVEGNGLDITSLTTAVESSSLFGSANAVFLESVFSQRPSNAKKQITEYLAVHESDPIYIWEPKDVTTLVKSYSPKIVTNFQLPKYIFEFLDTLSLESFRNTVRTSPVELLFASLVTRLHKVMLGQGRFKRNFSRDQLITMNRELLKIDYDSKTSNSPYDLSSSLELWLAKL